MFERYTEQARRVIFFARYEAGMDGSPAIEPEHLLLGIAREDKPLFERLLNLANPYEELRRRLEGRAERRAHINPSVELRSPRTRKKFSPTPTKSRRAGATGTSGLSTCWPDCCAPRARSPPRS